MDIRVVPDIKGPRTGQSLRPGERFRVSRQLQKEDGVLYLELADGRGWTFEGMPGVGTLCIPQAEGDAVNGKDARVESRVPQREGKATELSAPPQSLPPDMLIPPDIFLSPELLAPPDAAEAAERFPVSSLRLGQELQGMVVTVRPSGAFVDVGAEREGFVHISMMAKERVMDPRLYVSEQQVVTVWVNQIDPDGKLFLAMERSKLRLRSAGRSSKDTGKSTRTLPYLEPNSWHQGVVSHVTNYGLFVLITPDKAAEPCEGLVHVSQLSDGFVGHPRDVAEVGQEVRVRVISVEDANIRLSLREAPWEKRPPEAKT